MLNGIYGAWIYLRPSRFQSIVDIQGWFFIYYIPFVPNLFTGFLINNYYKNMGYFIYEIDCLIIPIHG